MTKTHSTCSRPSPRLTPNPESGQMERRGPHSSVLLEAEISERPAPRVSFFFCLDDAAVVCGDAAGPVTSTEWSAPAGSTLSRIRALSANSLGPPCSLAVHSNRVEKREREREREVTPAAPQKGEEARK
ncbi:unnamed protein product [Bursaphelenchus xylophilus]|uniref:(pine wood nematode) hypothetical protein n=1 Tax=Bursaphelenchus xylophilus TaxID=6326 RepID=A0A1I7RYH8_BURXY|nr:unnamed protein product [Bursaphelenchus xylophilus]CAG9092668.1 unnamed protein product [Bursaphelenchus xylophilus]